MQDLHIGIPLLLTFLAGLSTGIGSLIPFLIKDLKREYLYFSLGLSAGVMIYVSFVELLASAVEEIGFVQANLAFFGGIVFIMLVDFLVPHEFIEERVAPRAADKRLLTAGTFTMIGMAIHNFPEGLAVFMSAMGDVRLGVALAFAIAVHNIPEGIAVAMPIYYATRSKQKAFWLSLLSGVAEPLGALIGIAVLGPILTPAVLSLSLAFVAGIMIFISFDEILPLSYQNQQGHLSIAGIIAGMLIMALSLACL